MRLARKCLTSFVYVVDRRRGSCAYAALGPLKGIEAPSALSFNSSTGFDPEFKVTNNFIDE